MGREVVAGSGVVRSGEAGKERKMTFDDDMVELTTAFGPIRASCLALGVSWPPPEQIAVAGGTISTPVYRRQSYSPVSDERRRKNPRLTRIAIYVLIGEDPPQPMPGSH